MQHNKIGNNSINNYTNILVIPAYEPDEKMITLLKEIHLTGIIKTIVVDDGSGPSYRKMFREAFTYADVISYLDNAGKGSALKCALSYIKEVYGQNVFIVTADCDGQHTVDDILLIYKELSKNPDSLILGSRAFDNNVPLRSMFGNTITRGVFYLSCHKKVYDTQTGLRGFAGKYLDYMINIEGSRYEYEMNVLIKAAKDNIDIKEVQIKTIYIDDNKSTHFNTIKDSYRIYKQILKYSLSSILSFITDYISFIFLSLILVDLGSISLIISNIGARLVSSTLNYNLNRNFVFKSKESIKSSIPKYIVLATFVIIVNTYLLSLITKTILPNRYVAKITVEVVMFILNGVIQKMFIFNKPLTSNATQGSVNISTIKQ